MFRYFYANPKIPLEAIYTFLTQFGNTEGGLICTDLCGELVSTSRFWELVLTRGYIIEPTGADSPSQNGVVEKVNNMLTILVCVLLYSSILHAKFWSADLFNAVYLHKRQFVPSLGCTLYKVWYGVQSDLQQLKVFGSWVEVNHAGKHCAKLDWHDLQGIFLGYTATDANIWYLDLQSRVVKHNHHA